MNNRRSFLKTAAVGSLLAVTPSSLQPLASATPLPRSPLPFQPHILPSLPYPPAALEPYIDAQTMELHHRKHHAGYVVGLNKAEEELSKAREANDYAYIQHWSKQAAFHGGGHFLHSMFWKIMAPPGNGGGGSAKGALAESITECFGSDDAFRKQFSAAAAAVEGSGWALLHYRRSDQRLVVLQAENQHKLSAWDTVPILGLDVWEHAYYLKYQNRRAEYIAAWWNVVNWEQVGMNLTEARR
ncbi:MAG: superoxide dismutase [bacterium]|nr:superoxide dismutase [bacterium]